MITETMTSEELRKELLAEEKWVRGRIDGWRKKYHKKLKDKKVKENTLLGTSTYTTPRGNKVFVSVFKTYRDRNEKYADITFATLYSFWCGDRKRYLYPMNYPGTQTYKHSIVFSAHSVDRMKERLGMDITDVFVQNQKMMYGCTAFIMNDYNGKDDESYCDFGPCILLAKDHPWGVIVSTIIAKDQQHTNQQLLALYSSQHANIVSQIGAMSGWAEFEAGKYYYKRSSVKQAS